MDMSSPAFSPGRLCLSLGKTFVLIAISTVLAAGLTTAAAALKRSLGRGAKSPPPTASAPGPFVALGRDYLPELGRAYAAAWNEGALALDSGQPVALALTVVGQSWENARVRLFDRLMAPELARIVPDGQPEAHISRASRQALARAWRDLALGLSSPRP
jgi:hypothetical protein